MAAPNAAASSRNKVKNSRKKRKKKNEDDAETEIPIRKRVEVQHVDNSNLLCGNGPPKLAEPASLSHEKSYCSIIRVSPPVSNIQEPLFSYGLCVDAFVNSVRQGGVVFDHNEGSDRRLIFFPENDNTMMISVSCLHITREWDEVSGDWRPYGKWSFLKSLEKFEQEGPLPVSVQQIWYDVRTAENFRHKNLNWCCADGHLWDKLVCEAVDENILAARRQPVAALGSMGKEHMAIQSSNVYSRKGKMPLAAIDAQHDEGISTGTTSLSLQNEITVPDFQTEHTLEKNHLSQFVENASRVKGTGIKLAYQRRSPRGSVGIANSSCSKAKLFSQPVDPLSPYDSNYCKLHSKYEDLAQSKAKMHLLAEGWEFKNGKNNQVTYISPSGNCYYSWAKAYRACKGERNVRGAIYTHKDNDNLTHYEEGAESNHDLEFLRKEVQKALKSTGSWKPIAKELANGAEYCPQAIIDYCSPVKTKLNRNRFDPGSAKKANMHLLFMGWKIETRQVMNQVIFRYISPDGKIYPSLLRACLDFKEQQTKVHGTAYDNSVCKFDAPLFAMLGPEATSLAQQKPSSEDIHPSYQGNLGLEHSKWGCTAVPVSRAVEKKTNGLRNEISVWTGREAMEALASVYSVSEEENLVWWTRRRKMKTSKSKFPSSGEVQGGKIALERSLHEHVKVAKHVMRPVNVHMVGADFEAYDSHCKEGISPCAGKENENLEVAKTTAILKKRSHRGGFQGCTSNEFDCKALRRKGLWRSLGKEIISRAEYSPQSIIEYCECARQRNYSQKTIFGQKVALKAKMHLLFLGWKIESKEDRSCVRTRYVSPNGKSFYSLITACLYLKNRSHAGDCSGSVFGTSSVATSCSNPTSLAQERQGFEGKYSPACRTNQAISPSKRGVPAVPAPGDVFIEPEFFPHAVIKYSHYGSSKWKCQHDSTNEDIKEVRSKAKKHLVYEGWRLWNVQRQQRCILCYGSPDSKIFYSLKTACKAWMEGRGSKGDDVAMRGEIVVGSGIEGPPINEGCVNCVEIAIGNRSELEKPLDSESGLALTSYSPVHAEKISSLSYGSLVRVDNARKDGSAVAALYDGKIKDINDCSIHARRLKKRNVDIITPNGKAKRCHQKRVLRSSKRAMPVVVPSSGQHTVRTVLSWLIDNDVVLPRQKVWYKQEKDQHVMAEGRVSREGIKCKCCEKVYTLAGFGVHAGDTNLQPATNIFLQDGRSLLQCQMQILQSNKLKGFRSDAQEQTLKGQSLFDNDDICSLCHYGGELLLCDYCPSSFHITCIGLKDVPKGKWSCPSCLCGICGQSQFNGDCEKLTEQSVLSCDQCELEYHVGCLRRRRGQGLESCPQGNWFCSDKCSKIFSGLQKLLGKSMLVAARGLSWTLLRSIGEKIPYSDTLDTKEIAEHHSKLWIAVSVLHECFVHVIEPRTKRDLVTDVVFNRRSELKRLNFKGFYTVLLEKGDELISVATVRIYDEKVAEVPLICTRVQYRRQGMCRLLMDELEHVLADLGVERLFLPAIPSLLKTWTTSFGFMKMTNSDRLEFLDHIFLEFQETIMCQKLLKPSSRKAFQSQGGIGQ